MTLKLCSLPVSLVVFLVLLAGCDSSLVGNDGRIYAGGVLFGQQIALDRDVALVQASGSDDVFFLHWQGSSWQEAARMRPRHPRTHLAWTISLRGDIAVIGTRESAPFSGPPDFHPGLAYVYQRSGDTWSEVAVLQPDDLEFRAAFGAQVATDGYHLAISAPSDGINPYDADASTGYGTVHIYQRDGDTWTRTTRLENPSPTPMTGRIGDPFGSALALDDNRLIVAAGSLSETGLQGAGLLRVYTFDGAEWSETARITHPDARAGDQLGNRLALDGPLLAATASRSQELNDNRDPVLHIFRQNGADWAYESMIMPEDLGYLDSFGAAIAASGDRVAVGAPGRHRTRGALFIYVRDASGRWSLEQEIVPEGYGPGTRFGEGVAMDGDRLLVGAISVGRNDRGGVFEYRREGSTWRRVER